MLVRSFVIFAMSVAIMATASTALAQKNGMTKGSDRIPHQAQAEAAAKKLVSDSRFTAALNGARADEVKKMLVANGASADIHVAVQKAAFNGSSSGGPKFDYNGGGYTCTQWTHDWYWVWFSTPPPLMAPVQKGNLQDGAWSFRWMCIGLFTQNPYVYQQ